MANHNPVSTMNVMSATDSESAILGVTKLTLHSLLHALAVRRFANDRPPSIVSDQERDQPSQPEYKGTNGVASRIAGSFWPFLP